MSTKIAPIRRCLNIMRIVFLKEAMENLRDRRAVVTTFLTAPLLVPLLFVVLLDHALQKDLGTSNQVLRVPIVGAQYAPHLLAALKAGGVVAEAGPTEPEQAVREKRVDLVLRIAEDFDQAWRDGKQVQVELIYDSSRTDVSASVSHVSELLQSYAWQQGAMRLLARGLSPVLSAPLLVARRDQASASSRGALWFNMLPCAFVLAMFAGGMYLAIDLTAGERERQSLEPLFINPAPGWQIFLGKLSAVCAFSTSSLLLSMLTMSIAIRFLPLERAGIELDMGFAFAGQVLLLELPMVLLLAALQSLVSIFAKSFREAQTYLSLLMLLPMLPSVLLMLQPMKAGGASYAIPLLGQHLAILDLIGRGRLPTSHLIVCSGGTLVAALAVVVVATRLFRPERLLT